jgi:hypothetical protein
VLKISNAAVFTLVRREVMIKNVAIKPNTSIKISQIHQQNIAKCIKNMYFNKK